MTSISDASTLRDDQSTYSSSDTITNNGSMHNVPVSSKKFLSGEKAETILEDAPIPIQQEQPYLQYKFTNTDNRKALCYMDKRLNDPVGIYNFISRVNTALNPDPNIRIEGSHTYESGSGDNKHTVVQRDFLIYIPLVTMDTTCSLYPAAEGCVHRRNRRVDRSTESSPVDENAPTLEQWCERFCNSKWPLRVLRVETNLYGVDAPYIRNELCKQLRSTGYRGLIKISFPAVRGLNGVDIYAHSWFHRLRQTWLWTTLTLLFSLTPLWWAMLYPFIIYTTQYWDVGNVGYQTELTIRGEPCSTHEWLTQYSDLIKDLARSGFSGNAAALWKYGLVKTPGIPKRHDVVFVDDFGGHSYNQYKAQPHEWGHNGICLSRPYTV